MLSRGGLSRSKFVSFPIGSSKIDSLELVFLLDFKLGFGVSKVVSSYDLQIVFSISQTGVGHEVVIQVILVGPKISTGTTDLSTVYKCGYIHFLCICGIVEVRVGTLALASSFK